MKEGFGELYTRLYNENIEELEALRTKNQKRNKYIERISATIAIICVLVACIGGVLLSNIQPIIIIVIIGACVLRCLRTNYNANDCVRVFKQKILTPLMNNVFDDCVYEPDRGWSIYEYKKFEYQDRIDRYSSEDMITATIKGANGSENTIQFAEVYIDKQISRKEYCPEFYGLAGKMTLKKDISTKIYIKSNCSEGDKNNEFKMDMSEFERIFDVITEDKILALRILTADVMTEMIELYRKFKCGFEINIINNTVYMRLFTGLMFEPNAFMNPLYYSQIEKYYVSLKAMMNISTYIYNTINEIEL